MIHESARKYAKALFNLSSNEKEMQERSQTLADLVQVLKEVPTFHQFLLHPSIGLEQKKELLKKWIIDAPLLNFLLLLLNKGRFKSLAAIAQRYHEISSEYRGIGEGVIITATPIDSSLKRQLEEKLEKKFSLKSVQLAEKIEPAILGGAILILGNQIMDFSIQGRLQKLKRTLL